MRLEAKFDALDTKLGGKVAELEKENVNLRKELEESKARIDAIEQRSRINNLELSCIPVTTNEDTDQIVVNALKAVGVVITAQDISISHRVPTRNPEKPPNIVVNLVRRKLKFESTAAYRKFFKSKGRRPVGNDIHPALGPEPFYISEHLSPTNKKLLHDTKIEAKRCNYKFVYVNDGKIFVKKQEKAKSIIISQTSDLSQLQI